MEMDWSERAKRYLKAELKRADVTYEELANRLSNMGIAETKASISNKISRGGFPASFFLASMKAIGLENVRLDDL
jgi:3-mercaptopyruvate sulfurtransferase SseA